VSKRICEHYFRKRARIATTLNNHVFGRSKRGTVLQADSETPNKKEAKKGEGISKVKATSGVVEGQTDLRRPLSKKGHGWVNLFSKEKAINHPY